LEKDARDTVRGIMDIRQLAELRLRTGYSFKDGTPFYEKLGEERAAALMKALLAHGYRIVSEQELAARRVSSTPSDDDAQRTAGRVAACETPRMPTRKPRRRGREAVYQMGD
jgi:hypothetical protein